MPTVELPAGARIKTTPATKRRVQAPPGLRSGSRFPESEYVQQPFFAWAHHAYTLEQMPEARWIFAIPNGGRRDKVAAARAKAEGLTSGPSDVMWNLARGGYCGLCIEFKWGDNGMSQNQKDFANFVIGQGYLFFMVKDDWLIAKHIVQGYYAGQYQRP